MSIRTRAIAATALTAAAAATVTGAALATTGVAQAMPTEHDATASIVVHNDTDSTMFLDDSYAFDGSWSDAPWQVIQPHSEETITVTGNGGDSVSAQLDYHLSGTSMAPRGTTTLSANNTAFRTDTGGTHSNGSLITDSFVQAGYPHATFVYTIR
ncbi:MAG: hypothetical protein L0H59_19355 [Tomitella sp.]|nr:hypothetical protein [Tomitella sp.]